jgi:renalase
MENATTKAGANAITNTAKTETETTPEPITADIVVIGAGLAGLVCAQSLQQAGYCVVVVEKSKGLGGRLATRRLPQGHADHGVRCVEHQGTLTHGLIHNLLARQVLQPWTDTIYITDREGFRPLKSSMVYACDAGITAVAKVLGTGLEILRGQRVTAIHALSEPGSFQVSHPSQRAWRLTLSPVDRSAGEHSGDYPSDHSSTPCLMAKALVVAIPAPQALELVEPLRNQGLDPEIITALRSVQFSPCITAIAAYSVDDQAKASSLTWQAVRFSDDAELAWIAIDSSKQASPACPTVIVQSTPHFAKTQFDAPDLQSVGQHLLDRAASLATWLPQPKVLQVHRWRYAFVSHPLMMDAMVTALPLPIGWGGDWFAGKDRGDGLYPQGIEAALQSGLAVAQKMHHLLSSHSSSSKPSDLMPTKPEDLLTTLLESIKRVS